MRALFVMVALLLAGCGTVKERIVYKRIETPIYQPCKPKLDPRPAYPTEQGPVLTDIFDQMKTLLSERDLRRAREAELEAAVAGCAAEPAGSGATPY